MKLKKYSILMLVVLSGCASAPKPLPEIVQQGEAPEKFAVVKVNLSDYEEPEAENAATDVVRPICGSASPIVESHTDKSVTTGMSKVRVSRRVAQLRPDKANFRFFTFKCRTANGAPPAKADEVNEF